MKKFVLIVVLLIASIDARSQSSKTCLCDSILTSIRMDIYELKSEINKERFKLYPTENMYIFLKLDTATGVISLIQWSLDNEKEVTAYLNPDYLSYGSSNGTYELYPTQNMYQFILLNKVTGSQWHVQWGFKDKERWMRRIY